MSSNYLDDPTAIKVNEKTLLGTFIFKYTGQYSRIRLHVCNGE